MARFIVVLLLLLATGVSALSAELELRYGAIERLIADQVVLPNLKSLLLTYLFSLAMTYRLLYNRS